MAITVPVANTALSVAGFGKPVADEVNRLTPLVPGLTFTNLTLNAPWVAMGSGHPPTRYAKFANNSVMVQFGCSGGGSGGVIATLPSGFRPTYTATFLVRSGGSPPVIIIQIGTDGVITPYFPAGATGDICAGIGVIPLA